MPFVIISDHVNIMTHAMVTMFQLLIFCYYNWYYGVHINIITYIMVTMLQLLIFCYYNSCNGGHINIITYIMMILLSCANIITYTRTLHTYIITYAHINIHF
jgi:hypothetical protein